MKRFTAVLVLILAVSVAGIAVQAASAPIPEDAAPAQVGMLEPMNPGVTLDGTALSNGLDSPSKLTRYHAAATLAAVGSKADFANSAKVVSLLSEALSERGARVAFVGALDVETANLFQQTLGGKGYLVDVATDKAAMINVAFGGPIKDVLFIDASLMTLLGEVFDDYRTSSQPLVLIADEEQARDAKLALGKRVTGYILKPLAPETLGDAIDAAVATLPMPESKVLADHFNVLSATALAGISEDNAVFPVAQAVPALIGALELRDAVKLPVMVCLGKQGAVEAIPALGLLANAAGQSEAARLGAIDAIDKIARKTGALPADAAELMEALLLDASPNVRHAAAVALGANGTNDAALNRLIADPKAVAGAAFGQ